MVAIAMPVIPVIVWSRGSVTVVTLRVILIALGMALTWQAPLLPPPTPPNCKHTAVAEGGVDDVEHDLHLGVCAEEHVPKRRRLGDESLEAARLVPRAHHHLAEVLDHLFRTEG